MSRLTLIAINKYGEEIRTDCALSTTYQYITFDCRGTYHALKYKQTRNGNYFMLKGIRYYFKVYDNAENKWAIDCNCF